MGKKPQPNNAAERGDGTRSECGITCSIFCGMEQNESVQVSRQDHWREEKMGMALAGAPQSLGLCPLTQWPQGLNREYS